MSIHHHDDNGTDISRRGFLKGVGAGAVAGGILHGISSIKEVAAQSAPTVGPDATPITLAINGQNKTLTIEPRVTLLDALRNHLDLTGSKKVCDRGTCGACTVLIDDEVAYACSILAVEAQGRKITTIEGLGTPEQMSAVQESFVENDALQCGFCTPGFVLATTAFVRDHPGATLEEVRAGMGGNLCRCGTYVGITEVALEQAKTLKGGA
ncbi:MAG: (2Fe-2S)-binding protein [Candidatus Hydrogenedentes bacterium]|nr:(2Fe-2S)-binding protein [Candidatus Hydrogenedentota bacterium]